MYARMFANQFFRALFVSGAWYWRATAFIASALLIGLPDWSARFPAAAKVVTGLGVPAWAYGLAGSVVVACYFALQIAKISTPRVAVTDASIGPHGHVRLEITNTSSQRCEKLMCALTAVYNGCSAVHPRDSETYWNDHNTDFPLILPTQSRLRKSRTNDVPLPTQRWNLDPGSPKNIEVLQLLNPNATVVHESGTEIIELNAITTFCLRITGDTAPVEAFIVIYRLETEGPTYRTQLMLAKDAFDISVLQQFSLDDMIDHGDY